MIDPDLIKLIEKYTALPLFDGNPAELELYDNLGICGNNAGELMEEYSKTFGVSLMGFDIVNHFPNEGYETPPGSILPWMKIEDFAPLTIGELQKGIERKYLGLDTATAEAKHAPPSPEEEQQIEDTIFRLKNRLIYKPFFIITAMSMAGSALFCWLSVNMGYILDSWFLPLLLIHPVTLWIFVSPRFSLLQLSGWMHDSSYNRLQGGAYVIMTFGLPVIVPSLLLLKYFESGRNSLMTWAIITFLTGLFAFLAFIHTYPFNPQKLKEYARDKGIDIKVLKLKYK